MGAFQLRHRHALVGVVGQERVAGAEIGGRHSVLPERGDVGPSHLGLGRCAALLHQGVQQRVAQRRGRAVAGVEDVPGVAGSGVPRPPQKLEQEGLGPGCVPVRCVAVVQGEADLVGHHVGRHSPFDPHGLELLGIGAAVEHDLAPGPLGHALQQRDQAVDGVAPGEGAGRVGAHAAERDAQTQRALAARLHDRAGRLPEDGGIPRQEVRALLPQLERVRCRRGRSPRGRRSTTSGPPRAAAPSWRARA